MNEKHYGAIDGLRMIAAFGIVMMHIQANTDYNIAGFLYDKIIPSFTNFVFLFMTVSAFGMCCGYYEKVLNNKLSLSDFYGKRFGKVFPFFAILVLLDVIMSPSFASVCEGFADLTLLFGFLPNMDGISVIGVGWFLGLIFVFYLIFPFFCVLLENKKRAWISFLISIIYNVVCTHYFGVGRSNILYSACFFLAGGIIYLYRDEISKFNRWGALAIICCAVILYYVMGENAFLCLLVSCVLLIYAVISRRGLLENKVTKFFSAISMEIYLSHMVIFRLVERTGLNHVIGNGWVQYLFTVIIVLIGTIIFAVVVKNIIEIIRIKKSR